MEVTEEKPMEKTIPVFTVLKNGAILFRDYSSPIYPLRFGLAHGTWVRDQKVEPDECVEVKEGDVIRIGCSTRRYRLNWVPISLAYHKENILLDRMLEAHNQESQAETAPGDDIDGHLDVTSGSSDSSEDEDTMDLSFPLASSKVTHKKAEVLPFQPQSYVDASERNNISRNLSQGEKKMKWTIVLDTSSLLDKESRKPLRMLRGLRGTHLVIPRAVLREINETKRTWSLLFRQRAEIASSALDWIQECTFDTKWWIQVQSLSEEIKATPQSEDQVLQCALVYRNRNICQNLVLLSNDATLKIKAKAEDVICETPHEFYESLKNPFSERFMWPDSLPRGRTWCPVHDVVVKYNNPTCVSGKKPTFKGESDTATTAKGLKLFIAP